MERQWKELETTIFNAHNLSTRLLGIYHKEIETNNKDICVRMFIIVQLSIMKKNQPKEQQKKV